MYSVAWLEVFARILTRLQEEHEFTRASIDTLYHSFKVFSKL